MAYVSDSSANGLSFPSLFSQLEKQWHTIWRPLKNTTDNRWRTGTAHLHAVSLWIAVVESRSRRHIVARVGWFLTCSRGVIRGGSWELYGRVTCEGRGKEKRRLQTRYCSLISYGDRKVLLANSCRVTDVIVRGIHGWNWGKQFRKLLYFSLPFHARCTTNTHRPDGSLLRSVKPSNFFVSFSVGFTNRLWFTRMKSRTLWAIAKSMHPKTERRKHLRQSNQLFLRFSFM